jgi:hypothetical protein
MCMMEYEELILKKIDESLRCPVCCLVDGEEFNMLSHLQYDIAKDPQTREAVAHEGGFCEFHFRQFRKIANARTNALLLIALIGQFCDGDDHLPLHCRFCAHLNAYEGRLVQAAASLLKDASFRNKYEEHTGLCLEHLSAVRPLVPDEEIQQWLDRVSRTQMQRETESLEQMATKSYYDTSRLARGSVSRTVEKFVGRRSTSL